MNNSKTVIITGGTKGIGKGIAKAFKNEGYNVVICSRNDNGFAKEIGVTFVKTDVTKEKEVAALFDKTISMFGKIDTVINNVGLSYWCPIENVEENFLDNMLAVNLKSVFFVCKYAAKYLKAGSTVLNISSMPKP